MATKRMLIDASHPEETRMVVVSGNRVDDFDVEVESRRQIKGNIYLAKITRVEPSLQAAFVEYGGNRHGFLAFSEIHPDYYQIPVADREVLIAEEQDAQRAAKEAEEAEDAAGNDESFEVVGGDEDEKVRRPVVDRRRYKIQEVVKRRQIMLVQVVKEERGNKGAALTTYLSLAGRYCVLMPNTARGGGISRKIASGQDRKRLKSILSEFGIPDGMAVIVRTAGASRTKAEIKRDYEYLIRLWEQIRQKTLESMAPSTIHEEGNLIKRSLRDIYSKDIEEVIVDGDEGYRTAKDFMKLMMPSHAKRVQPYNDTAVPLLQRYQVEAQLDSMHLPEVQLKSGGYIVINSTEALVAIDVNSGRSTRERNIEETAYKTNIEAAEEIARQLRLRDLAGLIVIDFIDMENHRNQGKVERCMKDAMRNDRARIQIGRISPFGLLEMSRQRLRPSLQEMHSEPCPHCAGTGIRRSVDTTALQMLRHIDEEAMRRRNSEITMHVPTEIALYIFNNKRSLLARIEEDYQLKVYIENDDTLIPPDYRMDKVKLEGIPAEERPVAQQNANNGASARPAPEAVDEEEGETEEGGRNKRRRRRGRRSKRDDDQNEAQEARPVQNDNVSEEAESDDAPVSQGASQAEGEGDGDDDAQKRPRRRRRGRRAGRRRGRTAEGGEGMENAEAAEGTEPSGSAPAQDGSDTVSQAVHAETDASADSAAAADDEAVAEADAAPEAVTADDAAADVDPVAAEKPKRRPRTRRKKVVEETTEATAEASTDVAEAVHEPSEPAVVAQPVAEDTPKHDDGKSNGGAVAFVAPEPEPAITVEIEPVANEPVFQETARTTVIDVSQLNAEEKPARKGWWRRGD